MLGSTMLPAISLILEDSVPQRHRLPALAWWTSKQAWLRQELSFIGLQLLARLRRKPERSVCRPSWPLEESSLRWSKRLLVLEDRVKATAVTFLSDVCLFCIVLWPSGLWGTTQWPSKLIHKTPQLSEFLVTPPTRAFLFPFLQLQRQHQQRAGQDSKKGVCLFLSFHS